MRCFTALLALISVASRASIGLARADRKTVFSPAGFLNQMRDACPHPPAMVTPGQRFVDAAFLFGGCRWAAVFNRGVIAAGPVGRAAIAGFAARPSRPTGRCRQAADPMNWNAARAENRKI